MAKIMLERISGSIRVFEANTALQTHQDLLHRKRLRQQCLKHLSFQFLNTLENRLCVFSPKINQLFTNYEFLYPSEQQPELSILPNGEADYDTFSNVPSHAFSPTGLHIIPGELVGQQGLHFFSASPNNAHYGNSVPLAVGIRRILSKNHAQDPFLPVLMESDITSIKANTTFPHLHLHHLRLQELSDALSLFDIRDLQEAICDKLRSLNRLS